MGEVASQRVVVLGAGRVATHLVAALVRAGHNVAQVWSRTDASARRLAEPLGISYTDDLDTVIADADVYIVCVADSALPLVAEKIVQRVGETPLLLHTAGSVDMGVWHQQGAKRYGILYPLQTFSMERPVDMHEVSLFVEASDADALAQTEAMAHSLSDRVYRADTEVRARLHIAAVFACNFANAMYRAAHDLLSEAGIPFEVLLPLIDETASKVHVLSPAEAQTGPAVRRDGNVMQRHMEALAENHDLRQIYEQISKYIMQ